MRTEEQRGEWGQNEKDSLTYTNKGKFGLVGWQWLSSFFDDLITSRQIVTPIYLRFFFGADKHDVAFAIGLDHLSLQMSDSELKQKQQLAVESLLQSKDVMAKSSLLQNKLCLQTDLMKDESYVLNKNL